MISKEQFYQRYEQIINDQDMPFELSEAMKYAFISNGKLFRPKLLWAALTDLKSDDMYIDLAIAIEMIHTYSLVHDDLPAMDNDDYRRGRLTCHKVFGEDIAILVGDSLLTMAFELVANLNLPAETIVKLITAISTAAGSSGMIGGQVLDVKNESNLELKVADLEIIHDKKTALLLELPIKCANIIAGFDGAESCRAARLLGLLYQIQDDFLDTYGKFENTGKSNNSDEQKVTYSTLYSEAELRNQINNLSNQIKLLFNNWVAVSELVESIFMREG